MTSCREPLPPVAARTLHLTFDDGPDPVWTPRVLDALRAVGARATFFVLGEAARRHPATLRAVLSAGHEVGLHGDRHVRHDGWTADELAGDTDRALETLASCGATVRWWRAPWGVVTDDTRAVARARGLRLVGWHADTHDWRGDAASAMAAAVRRDAADGGIVLAHDGLGPGARRSGAEETVRLVHALAAWAADQGLATSAALPRPADGALDGAATHGERPRTAATAEVDR